MERNPERRRRGTHPKAFFGIKARPLAGAAKGYVFASLQVAENTSGVFAESKPAKGNGFADHLLDRF